MSEQDTATEPREAAEPPAPERVLLVPGHFFFTESFEVPTGLETGEVGDFAELSLESIAPFPVEQLNWGFFEDAGTGRLLVFATHRERLKQAGFEAIEGYTWVLPDFATLLGARFEENTCVRLQNEASALELHYEAGAAAPRSIRALPNRPRPENAAPPPQPAPSVGPEAPPVELRLSEIVLDERGLPRFSHTAEAAEQAGPWQSCQPEERSLWRADIRPADFKDAERRSRRTSALLTRILGWAAVLALLLLAAELLLLAGGAWRDARLAEIESQAAAVRRVEDKQSLMFKLEQVARNELRPVEILEALNRDRPRGIYFTDTVTEGENNITVEGVAGSVTEFNTYTETLDRSGHFDLLDQTSITRRGETTFTMTLAYLHGDRSAPAAPGPGAAAEAADTTPSPLGREAADG